MAKTLYFYDLETSGFSPREARIMQFAGQRTDLDLNLVGEPHNILIKITNEILPDPGAVLLTGITPQQTLADGITEHEFLNIFHEEIVDNDTFFVGFNSIRFDDEFMRYLHYRNFYDPYEWQWKDGRGKWDLLDVVRMTRALRSDGIEWPIVDGKPSNRLELLTQANNISHVGAHDALSDVVALIDLAKLIKSNQPKLFDYLLNIMGSKNNLMKLVNTNEPFVYTSGKYPSEFEKTTVVTKLTDHPKRQGAIVFDLRYDPSKYIDLSAEELLKLWRPEDKDAPRLPVKTLQFNRCPAIAPLSVLDIESQSRIKLNLADISKNQELLNKHKDQFSKKILVALSKLDKDQDAKYAKQDFGVDAQLYDGFFNEGDKSLITKTRGLKPADINPVDLKFIDKRLNKLLPLYKARNFSKSLENDEIEAWEEFRTNYLMSGDENSRFHKFYAQLEESSKQVGSDKDKTYIIEELKLYAESILPSPDY